MIKLQKEIVVPLKSKFYKQCNDDMLKRSKVKGTIMQII